MSLRNITSIYIILFQIKYVCITNETLVVIIFLFIDEDLEEFHVHVTRYRPEDIQKLTSKTRFTRKEIQLMYRGFKQVCSYCIFIEGYTK